MATSSFYSSTGPAAEDATALEGYKNQAAASADAAATSATDAASSASSISGAVSSAQNAQAASEAARDASVVAKNAAATSATTASNAIATTAASATSAATSATTATTKASEAATSATSASNSASTATTKASEASTSASNASTSESNAATSASAAATAKTNAETAETNAETAETNAAASATTATTKASEAAASATSASTSAGTATTKAGESSTSATNASTSATNASNSATSAATAQTAAEAARDAALAAFDSFDDRYLGQKSSAPTVDNDGNALVAGTLYFNTTTDEMKVYDSSQWLNAYASLSGALLATSNLSDLNNAGTARTNLGLGTAATTAASDYATAAQADQTVALTGAGATSISGAYPNFTITSTDTNTTYSVGDGGLTQNNFTDADHSKLNAIEASADVTDTANVTAAGALMDSELTSEASVKALNQGVATGDSPTFAGLTVGDGVSSKQILVDAGAGWADLKLHSDATNGGSIYFNDGADAGQIFYYHPENSMRFLTNATEKARLTSGGDLLVGQTSNAETGTGIGLVPDGTSHMYSGGTDALMLGRGGSDGDILSFNKSGTTVGSIGVDNGDNLTISGNSSHVGLNFSDTAVNPYKNGNYANGTVDLGEASSARFRDLYLSGGAYLGGTGSANKLDDYEEGTWTPTYVASGGGTITTGSNTGHYVKIGDFVFCSWRMRSTGVSGISGNIAITGFPFSAGSDVRTGGSVGYVRSWNSDMPEFRLYKEPSNTQMSLYKNAMNAGASSVTTSDFATGSDNNVLEASVVYKV